MFFTDPWIPCACWIKLAFHHPKLWNCCINKKTFQDFEQQQQQQQQQQQHHRWFVVFALFLSDVFFAPHLWDAGSLQPKTCRNWPVDFSAFILRFLIWLILVVEILRKEKLLLEIKFHDYHFNENEMNTGSPLLITWRERKTISHVENRHKFKTCLVPGSWT